MRTKDRAREIAPLFRGGKELTAADIVGKTRGFLSPKKRKGELCAVGNALTYMRKMGLVTYSTVQGKNIWRAT